MKILLYGYYNKNNLGDDLFEYILSKYLNLKNIEYDVKAPLDILNISKDNATIYDFILCGGGEIINDYFLIPLFNFIKNNKLYEIPIYGVSIGCDNGKYADFFDKCIFRNKIDIIDDIRYKFDNDIVFGLKEFYNIQQIQKIQIQENTIGYYLIKDIKEDTYELIKKFTEKIKDKYKINFIIFDNDEKIDNISRLINECDLKSYEIISTTNSFELINAIMLNEKHLCLRFHAHVLCYLYKKQFISLPVTNKIINFNNLYNIKGEFDLNNMLVMLDNSNIKFEDLQFNFNELENMLLSQNFNIINKQYSIWFTIFELFETFKTIYMNKEHIPDFDQRINYLVDQIELNILKELNTKYRYGLIEKLVKLCNESKKIEELCPLFVKVITDINK